MLLITGGSGFVGRNLANFFAPRMPVATTYHRQPVAPDPTARSFRLDITDAEAVFSVFERVAPKVVIHAAGNKNVRFCEDHPDEAQRVNALGTRNVARACRTLEARGEIRGGRFVGGFDGEQYALPEAVTLLREVRRRGERPLGSTPLRVCAADPLNLQGILTPDEKVPASAAYGVAVG